MKCPRDSIKESDWFRCEKISQKLKYLNFKCEQSEKIFFRPVLFVLPLCACPMRKISLATSEKREWKSGLSWKFCCGKRYGIERRFSLDFTAISVGLIDQMNTRLIRVFSHLQCRNISPERAIETFNPSELRCLSCWSQ